MRIIQKNNQSDNQQCGDKTTSANPATTTSKTRLTRSYGLVRSGIISGSSVHTFSLTTNGLSCCVEGSTHLALSFPSNVPNYASSYCPDKYYYILSHFANHVNMLSKALYTHYYSFQFYEVLLRYSHNSDGHSPRLFICKSMKRRLLRPDDHTISLDKRATQHTLVA